MKFFIPDLIIFIILLLHIYFRYDEKRKLRWLIEAFILVAFLQLINAYIVQRSSKPAKQHKNAEALQEYRDFSERLVSCKMLNNEPNSEECDATKPIVVMLFGK